MDGGGPGPTVTMAGGCVGDTSSPPPPSFRRRFRRIKERRPEEKRFQWLAKEGGARKKTSG